MSSQQPQLARMVVTPGLPPLGYPIPKSVAEIAATGGSVAGYSAVSTFLSCPERSRLRHSGVRAKRREIAPGGDVSEDPLLWGSILHAIRATRIAHGQNRAMQLIEDLDTISESDRLQLRSMWLVYNSLFPLELEQFTYLGVEVEVFSDVGEERLRSVRYDSVIQVRDANGGSAIFSFECKSTSRAGDNQFSYYMPQFMTQVALWNANPHLVRAYGPMRGVLIDALIKTKVPKVERVGPKYISSLMQRRALEYAALPERVQFPLAQDGSFPRMIHSCYGRFGPCEYVPLCLEDSYGEFTQNGEDL